MVSRTWSCMSRWLIEPVCSSSRSASVDLPWSMWAMMQKFRISSWGVPIGAHRRDGTGEPLPVRRATLDSKDPVPEISGKASTFTESVIREMTRLNLALHGPANAINFAQGFPDFEPVPEIVEAAHRALDHGFH